VFSTFGHFSKVKSHVFLTSHRLSRFGLKLGALPGQKVAVFMRFSFHILDELGVLEKKHENCHGISGFSDL